MKWLFNISTASTQGRVPFYQNPLLMSLAATFTAFWLLSFKGTTDLVNWYIENILVVLFAIVLITTYRKFQFSNLSYLFIFLFLLLHTYGAKYAYADNPLGGWMQLRWHLVRNPYDRIVHTSFGLLMTYPIRELLMRRLDVSPKMIWFLPVEMILSLAGLFELVEWSIADVFFPAHGKNYVGTQGDIWDAQKDMVVAVLGSILISAVAWVLKKKMQEASAGEIGSDPLAIKAPNL